MMMILIMMMMLSISPFGPVGCGRLQRGKTYSHQSHAPFIDDDDDDDDDDDEYKPVWPLGLWVPSSGGVRCIHINLCM
jgi:hypothetical protein